MDRWLAVDTPCPSGEDSDSLRSVGSSSTSSSSFSLSESRSSQTSLGLDQPEKPVAPRRRATPKLSLQMPTSRSPAMLNLGPVCNSPAPYALDEQSPGMVSKDTSFDSQDTAEGDRLQTVIDSTPPFSGRRTVSASPNDDGEQTPHVTKAEVRGSPSRSGLAHCALSSCNRYTGSPFLRHANGAGESAEESTGSVESGASVESSESSCFTFDAPSVPSPVDIAQSLPSLSPLGSALSLGPTSTLGTGSMGSGFRSQPGTRRKKMPAPLDLRAASVFASKERSSRANTVHVRDLVGVEGSQQQDRVIGKLMMKQQCESKTIEMQNKRPSLGLVTSTENVSSPRFQAAASRPSSSSRPSLNRSVTTADYSEPVTKSLVSSLRVSEEDMACEDDEKYPYQYGPREIVPGIWLGSEQNASDPELLHAMNISSILNVAKEVACPYDNGLGADALLLNDSAQSQQSQDTNPMVCVTSDGATSSCDGSSSSDKAGTSDACSSPCSRFAWMQHIRAPANAEPLFFTRKGPIEELDYCWMKWGHNEAELVESGEFDRAFAFLDAMRAQNRNILIHCQCGVSRSATVTIAYLMRETARKTFEHHRQIHSMHDAYSFVKQRSSWIGPNLGLIFQLVAYERKLKDQGSVDCSEASPQSATMSPPSKEATDSKWPASGSERPFLTPRTVGPPSHSSTPQSWCNNSSPGALSSAGSSPCTSATSWSSHKCT